MKEETMIQLLKIDHENNRQLNYIEKLGVDLDALHINLLDIVLEELGVPMEDEGLDDYLSFRWIRLINEEATPDIPEYITWVRSELVKYWEERRQNERYHSRS